MDYSKFHVIAVVSNPIRYQSRYNLYSIFEEDIRRKGAQLWTLEMQTGARLHKVTDSKNPRHLQLWTSGLPGEIWQKESMMNRAVTQLTAECPDWRYVLIADSDIKFEIGAIEETAQALQHWHVVQPWSHCVDLGPNTEAIQTQMSYMYCYWKGIEPKAKSSYLVGGHPGYAIALRREAYNMLGGFIDFAILGSADRHMMGGLLGRISSTVHGDMHPTYHRWLRIWQDRAEREIKRNVGFVHGTIRHMWHGAKKNRGYSSRWKILVENQFNPETDIKRDASGLWQLVVDSPRQIKLRDDIRKYFRARNEDSIDA